MARICCGCRTTHAPSTPPVPAGLGCGPVQQLGDHRFELAARLGREELAFLVDHEDGRDRVDAPGRREFALPAVTLEVLRPRDPFLRDERLELFRARRS